MRKLISRTGVTVSYRKSGSGPLLVLIHGGFSDHHTNWEFVLPKLEDRFTVVAVARRGRGETDATEGHTLADEAEDAVTIIESLGEPAFLLGHSYGAQVALRAAAAIPAHVRAMILYEPPSPNMFDMGFLDELEHMAAQGRWDEFSWTFFEEGLRVPAEELNKVRANGLWDAIVADAKATLGDLRALTRSRFVPEDYRTMSVPTLLQIGTESPRELYATDALAAVLPNVRIEELKGQAHEGMTTAPDLYAESVIRFVMSKAHRPSRRGAEASPLCAWSLEE